jgi:hypothetical protein
MEFFTMWKKILPISLLFISSLSSATGQYIASNAKITKVVNTASNSAAFIIVVEGGTGPCVTTTTQKNIYFPRVSAANQDVYDRAYMSAMTALSAGNKVNIYNYADGTCNNAVAIEIMAR